MVVVWCLRRKKTTGTQEQEQDKTDGQAGEGEEKEETTDKEQAKQLCFYKMGTCVCRLRHAADHHMVWFFGFTWHDMRHAHVLVGVIVA